VARPLTFNDDGAGRKAKPQIPDGTEPRMDSTESSPTRVIIVGGGVAALEAMLALREIGGDHVAVDLFAPRKDFVLKPLGVSEAFGQGDVLTYDLESLARNAGATFHLRSVTAIDRDHRRVRLLDGTDFPYDYLIVATGTKALWVVPGAKTFWGLQGQEVVAEIMDAVEDVERERILLTMPEPAVWPLPIYELALFMAAGFRDRAGPGPLISIVTPEPVPLQAFGEASSGQVRALLEANSVDLITDTTPVRFAEGDLVTSRDPIPADHVITLPRLIGRQIEGVPFDETGFLPVGDLGLIEGCDREFAAGDVISFPLKFGGAATSQADVVAEAIAAEAWGAAPPEPLGPDLRATLLTPDGPVPLGNGTVPAGGATEETWNPARKVRGKFLTPVLTAERSDA
jgi:sulfide:quinone oxidoreductase